MSKENEYQEMVEFCRGVRDSFRELTELNVRTANELLATRALCQSMLLTHPNPEKLRGIFIDLMEYHKTLASDGDPQAFEDSYQKIIHFFDEVIQKK